MIMRILESHSTRLDAWVLRGAHWYIDGSLWTQEEQHKMGCEDEKGDW
jgi:hypothetical protein